MHPECGDACADRHRPMLDWQPENAAGGAGMSCGDHCAPAFSRLGFGFRGTKARARLSMAWRRSMS